MSKLEDNLSRAYDIDYEINDTLRRKDMISKDELITYLKNILKLSLQFLDLKDQIKRDFVTFSSVKIENKKLRNFLQKISSNTVFLSDQVIKYFEEINVEKYHFEYLHGENVDIDNLDYEELDEIAMNELYSWWGPYDYIWGLVEIGVLVVGVSLPKNLDRFISEARLCYSFKQYNAVYSLCRTVLETSMRDIGIRKGNIKKLENDKDFYKEYPPRKLINSTTFGALRKKVHDLYSELSSLIHGYKTINADKAKSTIKETINIVEDIYSNSFD